MNWLKVCEILESEARALALHNELAPMCGDLNPDLPAPEKTLYRWGLEELGTEYDAHEIAAMVDYILG